MVAPLRYEEVPLAYSTVRKNAMLMSSLRGDLRHKRAEQGRGRLGGDGDTPQRSVDSSAHIHCALTHPFSAVRVVAVVRRRAQDGAIVPNYAYRVSEHVRRLCGRVAGRKRGAESVKVPGVAL